MITIPKILQSFAQLHKSSLSSVACGHFSADVNYQEQKITVGEHQINYVKAGSGPCKVLLMPGAMGSIWTDFTPQIKGLDKRLFTLIAWDPPGCGKSIPPIREYPIDFHEKDAEVAALLMKALEISKFSLMGFSDGSMSSVFLASKYPDAVARMVIWGTNIFISQKELDVFENIRDISKWSKKMREPRIELYGERQFEELANKWFQSMEKIYTKKGGDICLSELKHVNCPTLILHGAKDTFVDDQRVPILHSNIQNSIFHIYPEGGHTIHLKYAEDFNERVSEFLLSK